MKKKALRTICSLLCLTVLPGVFAGCKKDNDPAQGNGGSSNTESAEVNKVRYTDGVHVLTAPETDKWLVKDGQTEYKILMPEATNSSLMFAKEELYNRFYEATGVRLTTETESGEGIKHQPGARYISLGNTKMFESAGITLDKSLGNDGVRIVTKDSAIYINGGAVNGVLYGVYDFLQIYFDYDWFYRDCYSLNTGLSDVKLRAFDVTDIPDIKQRIGCTGYVVQNVNYSLRRFRYTHTGYGGSEGMFIPGFSGHNTTELISNPPEEYLQYYSDWNSDNGEQLCYTAHGNQASYNALVQTIAEKFEQGIIAESQRGTNRIDMSITIEDNPDMCACEACMAEIEKYGSNTGSIIKLCNAVMHQVKDVWMNSDEGKAYKNDDIRCCFFAYGQAVDPPTTVWNEEKQIWEVEYDELKMRDDVGVWLCFTKRYDRGLSFYAQENDEFREFYSKWADISSFLHTWGYQANFYNYLDFFNSFDFYCSSDLMQFVVAKGVGMWFNQAIANSKDATAFYGLKEYLQSKLAWDCTLDSNVLMDKYFKAMYAEAADIMREYFEYSKEVSMHMKYQYGSKLNASWDTNKAIYQPIPMLRKKMAYCDQALAMVEKLYKEQNPAKYEQLKFHIDLEWLSPAYHLITIHGALSLSEEEYASLGRRMYEAHKPMSVICTKEGSASTLDIKGFIESLVS